MGKVNNIKGEEYNLFTDKYLVSSNGKIHDELVKESKFYKKVHI